METSQEKIYKEFFESVNMAPSELEDWLQTKNSKSVGQDSGDGESIGHKSGLKIIAIKNTKKAELSKDDFEHMNKVVGYINRHKAQEPKDNLKDSNWRYSLKNWGYDPCKEIDCEE